jgi:predicted GNAT superfamily acetyltransferase
VNRPAVSSDFDAVLALNHADVEATSAMDGPRLSRLAATATCFDVFEEASQVLGFLLAFRETDEYDSTNFTWFQERYPRFLYIDRIVVGGEHRGRGIASQLYAALERRAAEAGIALLTCEVNVDPPNPASMAFHERRGFKQLEARRLEPSGKTVAMMVKTLGPLGR